MDPNLQKYFQEHQIQYKLHQHPPIFTVEEGIKFHKQIPGLDSKNLFLSNAKGKYYLVCMYAHKRLNIKKLKKQLGEKDLSFAKAEELKEQLNLTPGSVSIFGMIYASEQVTLLLDKQLWEADIVGFHPNRNDATVEINHQQLEKFYNLIENEKNIIEMND